MDDLLSLSAELPEVEFGPGDTIVREGIESGEVWVLLSGALSVRKGDTYVNTITRPGSLIGEVSVLLGIPHGATVDASEPSRLRRAAYGREFLLANPAVTHLVAVGLAERLNFVTSYLADLKNQYGDAPGLSMVPTVLKRLAERHSPAATATGSARDPNPEY
jgi:CRP-like cAMP-binding protein